MLEQQDTIAALASAPGGAVAVIRISGPAAVIIASRVWQGRVALAKARPRELLYGKCRYEVRDDAPGEPTLAVVMPGPASYTGEDVVELHCHGGALVARRVLSALLQAGARHAAPGEFTRRAFLNGKLDLTQAEAVAEIIRANSDTALRLAERQNAGVLGHSIRELRRNLVGVLAEIESRLDFPEEDLAWQEPEQLAATLTTTTAAVAGLLATARDGMIFRDGVRVVIAGRPNSGKSTLLNRFLGYDRAITADLPGTTRDTIEEVTVIRGLPLRLIDTAGIRPDAGPVEELGVARTMASLQAAQVVLWLFDATAADPAAEVAALAENCAGAAAIVAAWNKCDLLSDATALPKTWLPAVRISARTGAGLEALLDALVRAVWQDDARHEPEIAVSARHARLLEQVAASLPMATREIRAGHWELAAVALREAIAALGGITGESVSPDILDEIFSNFCIGK